MDTELLILIIVGIFHLIQAVVGGLIAIHRGKTFWIWFGVCILIPFRFGWIWMFMGTRDDYMP